MKEEELTPVQSSNLEAVGYNDFTLTVKFKNGSIYDYAGVPQAVAGELLTAVSIGAAFNAIIRGRYAAERRGVVENVEKANDK